MGTEAVQALGMLKWEGTHMQVDSFGQGNHHLHLHLQKLLVEEVGPGVMRAVEMAEIVVVVHELADASILQRRKKYIADQWLKGCGGVGVKH